MRPIDIANFESDANLRRRILYMPYGEAAQRLGAVKYEASSKFVFSQNGQDEEQDDTFRITQDANGAMHVVSQTPSNQVELYLVGENVWVRLDKGQLRQKSRRDTDTDELTAVAWSAVAEVLALFPRAQFSDPRHETVAGRSATRYRVSLGKARAAGVPADVVSPLPLPMTPHARWRDLAKPLDLTGSIAVDKDTGVVMKAEVDGHLEINDRPVRPTELTIHFKSEVRDVAHVSLIKTPHGIAEFKRPQKPRDPLAFFRDHLAPLPTAGQPDATKEDAPPKDD